LVGARLVADLKHGYKQKVRGRNDSKINGLTLFNGNFEACGWMLPLEAVANFGTLFSTAKRSPNRH